MTNEQARELYGEPLRVNLHGHGVGDGFPLDAADYISEMWSSEIYGVEWLFITTSLGRRFMAQANDAGGVNAWEMHP